MVNNKSLSLDGYSLITPFIECLHTANYANIGGKAMVYNGTDWAIAKKTVAISHLHISDKFNYTIDATARGAIMMSEDSKVAYGDILGELSALTQLAGKN